MTRPTLHPIPLAEVTFAPGTITMTMSAGQWDALLSESYAQGWTLLELDADERPVAAYRRCECGLCQAEMN